MKIAFLPMFALALLARPALGGGAPRAGGGIASKERK